MDLRELEMAGGLWRVSLPLAPSLDQAIVTPRTYLAGPENIGNQATVARRDGITILGVSVSVLASATAGGGIVTLRAQDAMYISGQTNDYDIWRHHTAPSTASSQTVDTAAWTLSPANYRTSPQGSGAVLELVTNANVSNGFITVWGIHGQLDLGGRKSFSGSPADWNA